MCTASIRSSPARALLTFNRDERIEREQEIPPAVYGSGEVSWLGPLDSQAGGTWIAVNSAGLAMCLMNGYRGSGTDPSGVPPGTGRISRGAIITSFTALRSRDQALLFIRNNFDPKVYASFRLTLLDRTGVSEFTWDGLEPQPIQTLSQPWAFQSSSSWRQEEVCSWRTGKFDEWLEQNQPFFGPIPSIHLLQPEGMEAWAPLMRRSYAMTRSITQIEMDWTQGAAEMRYWPLGPDQQIVAPPHVTRLALTDQRSGGN